MLPILASHAIVASVPTASPPPPHLSGVAASQHQQHQQNQGPDNNHHNLFSSLQLSHISKSGISLSKHFAGVVSRLHIKDILLPTSALLQDPPDNDLSASDYADYLVKLEDYAQRKNAAAEHGSEEDVGEAPALPPSGLFPWDSLAEDQLAELYRAGYEFESAICPVGLALWKGHLSFGEGTTITDEINRSKPGPRTRLLAQYRDCFASCADSPGLVKWTPFIPKPAPSNRAIHRRQSSPRASSSPAASSSRRRTSPSPVPVTASTPKRAASATEFFKRTAFAIWDGLVGGTPSSSEPSDCRSDKDDDMDSLDRFSSISRSHTPVTPIHQDTSAAAAGGVKVTKKTPRRQLLPQELDHAHAASVVDSLCVIPLYSSVARLDYNHPRVVKYYTQQGNLCGVAIRELTHLNEDDYYFDRNRPLLARRIRCVAVPTHNIQDGTVGAPIRRDDAEEEEGGGQLVYTPSTFMTLSVTIRPETPPVGDGVYTDPNYPSDAASGLCYGRKDRFSLVFDPNVVSSSICDASLSFYTVIPKAANSMRTLTTGAQEATAAAENGLRSTWLDQLVASGDAKPLPLVPVDRSSASRWPTTHTKCIRLYPGDIFASCTTQCLHDPSKAVSHFGGTFTIPFSDIWSASQGPVDSHDGRGPKSSMALQLLSFSGIRSSVFERNPLMALGVDSEDNRTNCCADVQFAFDPCLPMLCNACLSHSCSEALRSMQNICEGLPSCPLILKFEALSLLLETMFTSRIRPTAYHTLVEQYPASLLYLIRQEQVAKMEAIIEFANQLLSNVREITPSAAAALLASELPADDLFHSRGFSSMASLLSLYTYHISTTLGNSPTAATADGLSATAPTVKQMNAVSAHINAHSVGFMSIGSLLNVIEEDYNIVDDATSQSDSTSCGSAGPPSAGHSSLQEVPSSNLALRGVEEGESAPVCIIVHGSRHNAITTGHPTTTISHNHPIVDNDRSIPVASDHSSLSSTRHRSVCSGRAESMAINNSDANIDVAEGSGDVVAEEEDEEELLPMSIMSSRGLPTPTPTPPQAPAPAPIASASTSTTSNTSMSAGVVVQHATATTPPMFKGPDATKPAWGINASICARTGFSTLPLHNFLPDSATRTMAPTTSPSLPPNATGTATTTTSTMAASAVSSSTIPTVTTSSTAQFTRAEMATTTTITPAAGVYTSTSTTSTPAPGMAVVASVADTTTPKRSQHGDGSPHMLTLKRTSASSGNVLISPEQRDDTEEPPTSAKPSQLSQISPSLVDNKASSSRKVFASGEELPDGFPLDNVTVQVARNSGGAPPPSAAASSSAPVDRSTVVRELSFEEDASSEKPAPPVRASAVLNRNVTQEAPPARSIVASNRRSKTIEAALFLLEDDDNDNKPQCVATASHTTVAVANACADILVSRFRPRSSTGVPSSAASSPQHHLASSRITPTTARSGGAVVVTSTTTTTTTPTPNSFPTVSPSSTIERSNARHAPSAQAKTTTATRQSGGGAVSMLSSGDLSSSGGKRSIQEVCKELDDDIHKLLNRSSTTTLNNNNGSSAAARGSGVRGSFATSANTPSSNSRPTPSRMHAAIQEGAAQFAALKVTPPSDPCNGNHLVAPLSSSTRPLVQFERPPQHRAAAAHAAAASAPAHERVNVRGAFQQQTDQLRPVPNSTNINNGLSTLDRPVTFNARVQDYVSDQARHALLRGQQLQRPPSPFFDHDDNGGDDSEEVATYGDCGPYAQKGRRVDHSHPAAFTLAQPAPPLQAPHGRSSRQLPRPTTTTTTTASSNIAPNSQTVRPLMLPRRGDKAALTASIEAYQRAANEAPSRTATTTNAWAVSLAGRGRDPLTGPRNSGIQLVGSYQMGCSSSHRRQEAGAAGEGGVADRIPAQSSVRRVLWTGRPSDEDVVDGGEDNEDAKSCDIPSFVPDTRNKRGSNYRTPVISTTSTPHHGRTASAAAAAAAATHVVPSRSALRTGATNPAWSRQSSPVDAQPAATLGVPPTTARKRAPPAHTPKANVLEASDDDDVFGAGQNDADEKEKLETTRASAFRLFLQRDRYCREGEYELAARMATRPSLRTHRVSRAGLSQADALLSPPPPLDLSPPNHPMFAGLKRSRSDAAASRRPYLPSRYGLRYVDVTPEVEDAPHRTNPHPHYHPQQHQQYSYPSTGYPQPLNYPYFTPLQQPLQQQHPFYFNNNIQAPMGMAYYAPPPPPPHMYGNHSYAHRGQFLQQQGGGGGQSPVVPYHTGGFYPPLQQYRW